MNSNLFTSLIQFNRNEVPSFAEYPFNIPIIQDLHQLKLRKPVTFFIGENGVGKSTLIEAIAIAAGLNPEGGSQNFNFSTKTTHSLLSEYLTIAWQRRPKTKYFLRAESFYNVASEVVRLSEECGAGPLYSSYGGNLHECSHGESFLKLVQNRFYDHGFYILDEPEAALSPNRQMTLLCLIDNLIKHGSQFIIATHSPILISYFDGEILDLDDSFRRTNYEDTEIYQTYKMYLNNYLEVQRRMFAENN